MICFPKSTPRVFLFFNTFLLIYYFALILPKKRQIRDDINIVREVIDYNSIYGLLRVQITVYLDIK
jgi:hypothetical protein